MDNYTNAKFGKVQKVETKLDLNWLEVKLRSNFFEPILTDQDKKVISKENKKVISKENKNKKNKSLLLSSFF